MNRQLLIALALCACPTLVQADYLDVIAFKLKPACSMQDMLTLNQQMNAWGKPYGMTSEVIVGLFSDTANSTAWVGRSANATAFGKAWDAWRSGRDSGDASVGKLNARWGECTEILYRRAFDSY